MTASRPRLLSVDDVAVVCKSSGLVRESCHGNVWRGRGVRVHARTGSYLGWVLVATAHDDRAVWSGNLGDDASPVSELREALAAYATGSPQMALFEAVAA